VICLFHLPHYCTYFIVLWIDEGMKLSGTMVASSFGKLVMKENPKEGVKDEDIALALLMLITNNIGQVAFLNAQLNECRKIFFVGSFLRQNTISCKRLSYSIDFWSKGRMEALFLTHEGYFGALGTFLSESFGDNVDKVLAVCAKHHQQQAQRRMHHQELSGKQASADGEDEDDESETVGRGDSGGDINGSISALAYAAVPSSRSGKLAASAIGDSNSNTKSGSSWRNWRPMPFSTFMKIKRERGDTPKLELDTPPGPGGSSSNAASTITQQPQQQTQPKQIPSSSSTANANRSRASTESSLSTQPDGYGSGSLTSRPEPPVPTPSSGPYSARSADHRDHFGQIEEGREEVDDDEDGGAHRDLSHDEYREWERQIQAQLSDSINTDGHTLSAESAWHPMLSAVHPDLVSSSASIKKGKQQMLNRGQRTMSENYTSLITPEAEDDGMGMGSGRSTESRSSSKPASRANSGVNSRSSSFGIKDPKDPREEYAQENTTSKFHPDLKVHVPTLSGLHSMSAGHTPMGLGTISTQSSGDNMDDKGAPQITAEDGNNNNNNHSYASVSVDHEDAHDDPLSSSFINPPGRKRMGSI
jgi:hypothetical protein